MSTPTPPSPVVVEPVISDEKLAELLSFRSEYPELDFKQALDVKSTKGKAEFAKDVGAMQVVGGYIVVGVDRKGTPCAGLEGMRPEDYDDATLADIARSYLPDPITIHSTWFDDVDGHPVVLIYIGPHPHGYAAFKRNGDYSIDGAVQSPVFRAGDIFWRQGSKSVRALQDGYEAIIARRVRTERDGWVSEHEETTRRTIDQLRDAYESRQIAAAPLGALTVDLDSSTLSEAFLDLARQGDVIPLRYLLRDAVKRSRDLYERDDFEAEIGDVLDKLVCLAATFLEYELSDWFDRVVETIAQIYNIGLRDGDQRRFEYGFDPREKPPRLWLTVIERVYALGALAAHLRRWDAVKTLTLTKPEDLGDYYTNWLRHTITMASRARLLGSEDVEGKNVLTLARQVATHLECLREAGLDPDADEALTALVEFDILSILAAIGDAKSIDGKVFYPNFARFRNERVEPVVIRLLGDPAMKETLFPLDPEDLAIALREAGRTASNEGFSAAAGFYGWRSAEILDYIEKHHPKPPPSA